MRSKKMLWIALSTLVFALYSFALLKVGMHIGYIESRQAYDSAPQTRYVVKAYNGMIAVFEGDAETPQRVFDIRVETLRKQDRERFEEGVVILSLDELARLIEDFGS